ncbi:MAG: glycosyltransferase [Myxococcales bacterium]|nr:glycosyltransferase [Myxococcales bacterium]
MTGNEVGFWLVAGGGALFRLRAAQRIAEVLSPRWRLLPGGRDLADPSLRVSVCIPARDEAAVIDRVLASLDAQDHADTEVIVCDDRSSDDTGERARAHRCRVIEGTEPPAGWLGKQWALQTAAAAATGELLCFADADTWHHPAALRTCAAEMERDRLDVLVVVGGQALGTWSERLVMPMFWTALLSFLDVRRAEDPERPHDAMGNGQFWLVRRAAYDRIGGHERVKDRLAEDVAIVRALKADGARYRLRFGPTLTATRMYTGFGSLWRGFQKNAAVVDPAQPVLSAVLTLVAVMLLVQAELWPWLVLGLAPTAGGLWAHPLTIVLAAAQAGALIHGRASLYRSVCDAASGATLSRSAWLYLAQPFGAIIGMAAILNSMQAQLRGATLWKGRRVRGRSL